MAEVRVGVGAVVRDGDRVLVLRRAGAHGAGTWGLPGGHQEFGESPEQTAVREVAEETGLTVVATSRLGFTDDPMLDIGRHYVTLFVACERVAGEARIMEPAKATELAWLNPAELRARRDELFAPLRRFLDLDPGRTCMLPTMDVEEYLARIGATLPSSPTAEALGELHEAHMRSVPFENYDIQAGIPISLDLGDLHTKIVTRHRGGFCYELNGLFAALLRAMGFEVTLLSAFMVDAEGVRGAEFEHLRLRVETPDGPMLADVGNSGRRLRPVPLQPGEHGDVQVHRDGELWWTSERHSDGRWERGWSWTAVPRELSDFTARCRFQERDPASHFVTRRLASMPVGDGRISLLNGLFAETDGAGRRTETALTAEQERAVLAERFGIVIEAPWRKLVTPLQRA